VEIQLDFGFLQLATFIKPIKWKSSLLYDEENILVENLLKWQDLMKPKTSKPPYRREKRNG